MGHGTYLGRVSRAYDKPEINELSSCGPTGANGTNPIATLRSRNASFATLHSTQKEYLVACAASNRTAELSAIARNEVVFRDNDVVFKPREGFILKNQTQFHAPSLLRIPSLPDSPLCPVRAVRDYLADTQASTEPGLFLHPISGKTLNAGRLAYFLVKAIRWLLPDALPNAHDVRRLSTTHAFAAGVSLDKILMRVLGGHPPLSQENIWFHVFHPLLVELFWPDAGFNVQ